MNSGSAKKKASLPDVIVALGAAGRIVVETLLEDPEIKARVVKEAGRLGKKVGRNSYVVGDITGAMKTVETIGKIVDKLHVTGEAMGWFNRNAGATQAQTVNQASPYFKLGLAENAPIDIVKLAYKHLVTVHHPDRGGDGVRMAEINAAYGSILKARGIK